MKKVEKLIVETFENDQPIFCALIKQDVSEGKSRVSFIKFLKKVFKNDYETSITAQLSITCFDYYMKKAKKIPAIPPEDYKGSISSWIIALVSRGLLDDSDGSWYGDVWINKKTYIKILKECES